MVPQQGGDMTKIDYRKYLKPLYDGKAGVVADVEVPPLRYLMIDGRGDPNQAPAFQSAIEALYSVAYTARFMLKRGPDAIDCGVMPLEGLWWADDMSAFASGDRAQWQWTLMILQPHYFTEDVIHRAMSEVKSKKTLAAIDALRFESLSEGRCAQTLHVGPFATEGETIARLHEHIAARGALRGRHHEIYLSDMRRAAPSKWKTLLRQPLA
jgi:hypothetical protein